MKFLYSTPMALTPLSPIHIGSGHDIEPTNYVIQDSTLFGFDPARATLPTPLAKRLAQLGDNADLLGIQRFFLENAKQFIPYAESLIPVAKGLAEDYKKSIGQVANQESNGNQVINQLFIERAEWSNGQPYIPGTALKGLIRTAWLDALNKGQKVSTHGPKKNDSASLETRLFGGDFNASPLRQLKPSDLMPNSKILSQVLYAVNLKKDRILDENGQERKGKGLTTRKECILPGQYRAFQGSLTLHSLGLAHSSSGTPNNEFFLYDSVALVRDVNAYHKPRLLNELNVLNSRGLLSKEWHDSLRTLLEQLDQDNAFADGRVMLVRLGRYGGAESKTLSGDGVAQIKIQAGKNESYLASKTKTVWLAAQTKTASTGLQPFGWGLIEIGCKNELPVLQQWCKRQRDTHPDVQEAQVLRHNLQLEVQEQQARLERARLAQQEEQAREEARIQKLQNMTPAMREIETFVYACQERLAQLRGNKDRPNTQFHAQAGQLARKALESADWTPNEKAAVADAIETWIPQIVSLDVKDMRKKLKLIQLRSAQ